MKENPQCQLCSLHMTANPKSISLKGRGDKDATLLIFLDAPSLVEDRRSKSFVSDGAEYLDHLMALMSIPRNTYYLEYILKCYPKPCKDFGKKAPRQAMIEACSRYRIATLQFVKPKVIVCMGTTACEAVMGSSKIGEFEGTKWTPNEPLTREFVDKVWITYNPAYGLEAPAEAVGIYRVLFTAAQEAGLNPVWNNKAKFNYGT